MLCNAVNIVHKRFVRRYLLSLWYSTLAISTFLCDGRKNVNNVNGLHCNVSWAFISITSCIFGFDEQTTIEKSSSKLSHRDKNIWHAFGERESEFQMNVAETFKIVQQNEIFEIQLSIPMIWLIYVLTRF